MHTNHILYSLAYFTLKSPELTKLKAQTRRTIALEPRNIYNKRVTLKLHYGVIWPVMETIQQALWPKIFVRFHTRINRIKIVCLFRLIIINLY